MREKGTYMVIKNKSAKSYLISLFSFDIIKINLMGIFPKIVVILILTNMDMD